MEVLLNDVSHSLYSSSSLDRCKSSLLIDLLAARCDLAEACWSESDFDPHQRFMKRFHGGDDGSCLESLIFTLFYAALAANNVKKIFGSVIISCGAEGDEERVDVGGPWCLSVELVSVWRGQGTISGPSRLS